ncbi:hypothetical protein, partial [Asanoa sp. NPDC050611]|uniref:hypothetical protein n=1 Tax=Asanoa sp. NPDC050611 TaxID=3157098 RepID=UPI0033D33C6C
KSANSKPKSSARWCTGPGTSWPVGVLSHVTRQAIWTYGVDWDELSGWIFDILEAEPGVVFADAGDSGWFQLGLDSPRHADEVLALFLGGALAAYRRGASEAGIQCP